MTKRKKPEDKLKAGRPTMYSLELATEICNEIASNELGLAHLVDRNPHWPVRSTIFVWIRTHPEFKHMYTRAKEDQVEVSVEYMQEIMNEPHKYVDEETGLLKLDHNMLRLKMDAIKWQASKLKARKYGDLSKENPEDATKAVHDESMKRAEVLEKDY